MLQNVLFKRRILTASRNIPTKDALQNIIYFRLPLEIIPMIELLLQTICSQGYSINHRKTFHNEGATHRKLERGTLLPPSYHVKMCCSIEAFTRLDYKHVHMCNEVFSCKVSHAKCIVPELLDCKYNCAPALRPALDWTLIILIYTNSESGVLEFVLLSVCRYVWLYTQRKQE